jgi:hypothetical protein
MPGGPASKSVNSRRIEKGDIVVAIDPDGESGFIPATASNVISLLRGKDQVGSHVIIQVQYDLEKANLF